MRSNNGGRRLASVVAVLAVCGLWMSGVAAADNPASGVIPSNGQPLHLEITSPADGSLAEPGQDLVVRGQTGIGRMSGSALAVYVIDVSASTQSPVGRDCDGDGAITAADNLNGDARVGDTLDCEIAGVMALNRSLPAPEVRDVQVGMVAFGGLATGVDMGPTAGDQILTTPVTDADGDGTADVDQIARSHRVATVGLFAPRSVSPNGTSFQLALTAVADRFGSVPADPKVVYLLTDGAGTTPSPSLIASLAEDGFIVQAFAVNRPTCGFALERIAAGTNGTCTPVQDPSALGAVLGDLRPAGIERVEVTVGGGTPRVAELDALGGFEVVVPAAEVPTGSVVVEATVFATDPDSTQVTADITLTSCGETGLVSGPLHSSVEPLLGQAGLGAPVHTISCDLVVPLEKALAPVLRLLGL